MKKRILGTIAACFIVATPAFADCGTNQGENFGPEGSYIKTCSTYLNVGGTLYALCDGCGTTFSALNPQGVGTCTSISNSSGVLKATCPAPDSISTSFTKSSSCRWEMTSENEGTLTISCKQTTESYKMSGLVQECPGGISNKDGVVTCKPAAE